MRENFSVVRRDATPTRALWGGTAVPIDTVEADRRIRMTISPGEPLPLHCTAPGKVHLAFLHAQDLRDAYVQDLRCYTDRTITDRDTLSAELERIVEDELAIETGEFAEDVNSLAVPVRDYTRNVVATLCISGPAYRITRKRIEGELKATLLAAGADLSRRLGFEEPA